MNTKKTILIICQGEKKYYNEKKRERKNNMNIELSYAASPGRLGAVAEGVTFLSDTGRPVRSVLAKRTRVYIYGASYCCKPDGDDYYD